MKFPQRALLLLGAILCIGAFFLPYMSIDYIVGKAVFGGYNFIDYGLSYSQASTGSPTMVDKVEDFGYDFFVEKIIEPWIAKGTPADKALLLGLFFVIIGPIFYLLFGLGYLWRGIVGKPFKRGIIFNLLYFGFSWLILFFISGKLKPLSLDFFYVADFGYWLAFAGVFVAAFSDFLGSEEATK